MLEHTLNWYRGEVFEGQMILVLAVVVTLVALLCYFVGTTPYAKALLIPFLLLGLLLTGTSLGMIIKNQKAQTEVVEQYEQDAEAFRATELKRVEGFMYMYPTTLAVSTPLFIIAVLMLALTKNVYLHATALALVVMSMSMIGIDYFSKERALIYQEHLQQSA